MKKIVIATLCVGILAIGAGCSHTSDNESKETKTETTAKAKEETKEVKAETKAKEETKTEVKKPATTETKPKTTTAAPKKEAKSEDTTKTEEKTQTEAKTPAKTTPKPATTNTALTKTISGVELTIKDVTEIPSGEKADDQPILKISAHIKNTTASPKFFDSLGMDVYNKAGKKLKWYPSTNFAGSLDPQKETDGDSFYVSSGEGPYKIVYTDLDSPSNKATWTNIKAK
ncbi:hypothetical protein [Listeria rustica]|uniref:DUF4352 domain-containing protein n=1 Tax=Listeria rustica TaxID=2713503 RepID=A0A7W1T539_9LIST|nr:hypothetical protein [Listeria rustica]MBA3925599.1 hypothetical protein [Listeria rustica]